MEHTLDIRNQIRTSILFVLSLIFLSTACTQPDAPQYDVSELKEVLRLDSLDHAREHVVKDGKLYLLGYKFIGSWASTSKLFAIDLETLEIDWEILFNDKQTNRYLNLNMIGEDIFISGVSGVHDKPEDSEKEIISLNPTIIKINKRGKIKQTIVIDNNDAYSPFSHGCDLVEVNGKYYLSYHSVEPDDSSRKYRLKLIKLSKDLRHEKTVEVRKGYLNHHYLNSINNELVISGVYDNRLKVFSIDPTYLKISEVKIPLELNPRIDKHLAFQKGDKINFVSGGHPKMFSKRVQIVHSSYDGKDFSLDNLCEFGERFTFVNNYLIFDDKGFLSMKYDKKVNSFFRNSNCRERELFKLTGVNRLTHVLFPDDFNSTLVLIDKGNSTMLYKFPEGNKAQDK